jgi:hypothetical protein
VLREQEGAIARLAALPRRSTFAFSSKPTMSRRESVPNWADFALDTSVRRVPSTSRSVARIS